MKSKKQIQKKIKELNKIGDKYHRNGLIIVSRGFYKAAEMLEWVIEG